MRKECENRYKICRNNVGFTQEQAAELLVISVSSLSDYENGKTPVPEDIVDRMVDLYQAPYLGYWHLRETNPLGKKCMPEVIEAESLGDMAFLAVTADDDLGVAIADMKDSIQHLKLDNNNLVKFEGSVKTLETVSGKLLSAAMFGKKISKDVPGGNPISGNNPHRRVF